MRRLFTSESVTKGHPDKICDQVSDAVLDAVLKDDKDGRVAVEALTTRGLVMVAGEITTKTYVDIPEIVREVIKKAGYVRPEYGFDYQSVAVITSIQEQSPDIAQGVNIGGAGDQGIMFGYATDETPELMPMPISFAHKLVRRLTELRENGTVPYLRPDGKSQVTFEYDNTGTPVKATAVVLSAQHDEEVKMERLTEDLRELVINYVIPEELRDKDMRCFINPTGKFVQGGPVADTGVTGRKIMVDTYGSFARHGGGCFSGKDPSKVDRSAAYMARYIAKNIVKAGIAKKVEVQLAYAIGISEPVAVNIDTFGTSKYSEEQISRVIRKVFDLSPRGIIERLELLRPIFYKTAVYGHFGREEEGFTWELTNAVKDLQEAISG
ncbi:MAG: methionine adenosyltransferase [Candidatus Hydrothermia bacterium]|nr:methionine adenosyltransferase [Candidatus Hydrothermae bacterium]MDD3649594.1 methionine adenosyltransferase [Candidatus Hydrothermia bacterium]MDD5573433.1 methionine adenosyltransferase [Candidatus Hydrothermia bacterium]HOK23506.1 methionine adenosyltransferase [Candidatus Hydrothermia bacterium]HOL24048.1 methionine adenosyltransferase [Candidatus Hydrothermia bacterium]